MRHSVIRLLLVALLALGTGALVACGSDDSDSSSSDKASSTPAEKKIKVAMVTDIGGLNDRGFNALAYKGLQQAKADLGADIRVVTSKSNADYVPNLSSLARQKYDLVVAVGFLMGDATAKVAKSFPQTNFAIVDFPSGALKGKPKNVHGLLFKENEPGYLAGYMAGLYVKKKGGDQVDLGRRRPEGPRGRRLRRGLAGRREEGQPGRQDAQSPTRRTSSTRRSARRSRSTRSTRARRSSSRSRASAASARSTPPRRRTSRPSASTPTSPTSARR